MSDVWASTGWATVGDYWGDRTGIIWVECPKHGRYETKSMPIVEALLRVHDLCDPAATNRVNR